jgi:hypothetical protein
MKYNYTVRWDNGAQTQTFFDMVQTPEQYAAIWRPLGGEILNVEEVPEPMEQVWIYDLDWNGQPLPTLPQYIRDRNGPLAVQLEKNGALRTWSIDNHGGEIIDDLLNSGWRIVDYFGKRGTGTPEHQFLWGGWLIDGHPLNVITGLGWIDGQLTVIRPYVATGELPPPFLMMGTAQVSPALVLDPTTQNILDDALRETDRGVMRPVTDGPEFFGGVPWGVVAAAGAGLGLLMVGSKLVRGRK